MKFITINIKEGIQNNNNKYKDIKDNHTDNNNKNHYNEVSNYKY